jgi:hypothetical protein
VRFGRVWIVPFVLVVVVAAAALGAGKSKHARSSGAATVLFGTRLEQTPSAAGLDFINGWVVRSTADDIAVYAGSQTSDSTNGLLVVVRTSGGKQRSRNVVVHGSGPVTLLRPSAPSTESVAAAETLRFVTANGSLGKLDLSDDKVVLSSE